jgi:hypothetical protein
MTRQVFPLARRRDRRESDGFGRAGATGRGTSLAPPMLDRARRGI